MGKKTPFYVSLLLLCLLFAYCGKDDGPDTPDSEPPVITGLSATEGKVGDELTITGTDLAKTGSQTTVSFAGTTTSVSSAAATSITTTVPARAQTGKITVSVGNQSTTSTQTFTVLDPQPMAAITDFEPKQGGPGTLVTITGNNFGPTPLEVYFGDVKAVLESISPTLIEAYVPEGATDGPIKVVIIDSDQEVVSEENFKVLPWRRLGDFPGEGRRNGFMLSVGDKVYMGLGRGSDGALNDFWEYDPNTDSWTELDEFLGGNRMNATAFAIDNIIYVGAGSIGDTTPYHDFYAYDINSGKWSQLNDIPVEDLLPIIENTIWNAATCFSLNGKGYAFAGQDTYGNVYASFLEYDPESDSWTDAGVFDGIGDGRSFAASFTIGTSGYVTMGSDGNNGYENDLWEFNTEKEWTNKMDYPADDGRFAPVAFVVENKAYVGIGDDNNGINKSDFWEYTPTSNTWIKKTSFANGEMNGRSYMLGTSAHGKGYVGFGLSYIGVDEEEHYNIDFWEYDPTIDQ